MGPRVPGTHRLPLTSSTPSLAAPHLPPWGVPREGWCSRHTHVTSPGTGATGATGLAKAGLTE